MKLTSIQLKEKTRRKVAAKKVHPRESYDDVINRILEEAQGPTMEEMFKIRDSMQQKKVTTEEIVRLTHELR